MRGFSLFAPVIGLMMLVIAVSISAMFYQNEIRAMHRVGDIIAQASSFSLTEAMKNDMITMFAVGLREYFLEFHEYNIEFFTSPEMPEIGKKWLKNFFDSLEGDVQLGPEWISVKVEDSGWEDIANSMDIKSCGNNMLLVVFDVREVEMPEMNISSPSGSVSTYVLPRAKIGFPVYFPVEDVKKDLEDLENFFKGGTLSYGFCQTGSISPVIIFKGHRIYPLLPKDSNTNSDPVFPCYYAGEMVDDTKINAWRYTEEWANIVIPSVLNEYLKQQGSNWDIKGVRIVEKDVQEVPYARIVCVPPRLAGIVSNDAVKDEHLCVGVQNNENVPKCYHAKKIEVYATKEYTNPCAPGKKIHIKAKFTVDLTANVTGGQISLYGQFAPSYSYMKEERRGGVCDDCGCCGEDCTPCKEECDVLYTCEDCGGALEEECREMLPSFFESACEPSIGCIQVGRKSCSSSSCGSPSTPFGLQVYSLYPPECGCHAKFSYGILWENIVDIIREDINKTIECDSYGENKEMCDLFYKDFHAVLFNPWKKIAVPANNYILSVTFVKENGRFTGICTANESILKNIK